MTLFHPNAANLSARPRLAMAVCVVCLSLTSCNWLFPRGEGFNDEMSTWSRNLRKQEKSNGTPLGTSEKALEIERNLGYH